MTHFVNKDNTQRRDDDTYKNVIEQIEKDKVCPFCPDHLATYHTNPILKEGANWLITRNMYPYKGAKHHLLLIHKEHIEHPNQLSPEARQELFDLASWATKEYSILGGTLFMRFGDTKYTGASVSHLHAQIVSGEPTDEDYMPIVTRVG